MLTKAFLVFYIIGSLLSFTSFGQQSSCDSVYKVVEEMPKFGTSGADLMVYMAKNLKFKKDYQSNEITFSWTINKEGNMIDIDVLNLNEKCKADIVQQLKEFPKWEPGSLDGKPVCVKMTLTMRIKFG